MQIRMRTLLGPLCLLLALALPTARAQGGDANSTQGGPPSGGPQRGGPPSPAQELTRLTQALSLSDDQKTAILPILEKRHTDMEALRSGSSDGTSSREQMHSIMEKSNAEIRALLTESQQQIFDKMRPGGRQGGGPPSGSSGNDSPPQ